MACASKSHHSMHHLKSTQLCLLLFLNTKPLKLRSQVVWRTICINSRRCPRLLSFYFRWLKHIQKHPNLSSAGSAERTWVLLAKQSQTSAFPLSPKISKPSVPQTLVWVLLVYFYWETGRKCGHALSSFKCVSKSSVINLRRSFDGWVR